MKTKKIIIISICLVLIVSSIAFFGYIGYVALNPSIRTVPFENLENLDVPYLNLLELEGLQKENIIRENIFAPDPLGDFDNRIEQHSINGTKKYIMIMQSYIVLDNFNERGIMLITQYVELSSLNNDDEFIKKYFSLPDAHDRTDVEDSRFDKCIIWNVHPNGMGYRMMVQKENVLFELTYQGTLTTEEMLNELDRIL